MFCTICAPKSQEASGMYLIQFFANMICNIDDIKANVAESDAPTYSSKQ